MIEIVSNRETTSMEVQTLSPRAGLYGAEITYRARSRFVLLMFGKWSVMLTAIGQKNNLFQKWRLKNGNTASRSRRVMIAHLVVSYVQDGRPC